MELSNTNYTDPISDKEKKIVYSVLAQYNFEVNDCMKIKSVYKIKTTKGSLCLKRIRQGNYKIKNSAILAQQLIDKGYSNVAKYFKTKDGKSYVRRKKLLFYVTDWMDGKEFNLDNTEEVISIIKSLAQFHLSVSNMDTNRLKLKSNLKNWPKIFTENLRDLERYERIINHKRIKGEFDLSYYDYIQSMYHRGMVAINLLNTVGYYKLSKKYKTLCQNNIYYKNIIKNDDKYYIIDLNDITIDLRIADLGKLINRLMSKKSFNWDFNKAKLLIESYTSINKLDKDELEVMLALIVFPRKFCKLGGKRYIKHKSWDEAKYMHKLTKLIKHDELQNKFLEDYLYYLNQFH